MKKTLAILLALALVFSSISFTFAEETLPVDAQAAKDLGMLVGDQSGVTVNYLNTAPTRIQAAIMVLRLKGLEDDAKAFTGTDNFADADKAAWAKPIMAYLKANPQVGFGGVGNNSFNPAGNMDAKSYYKVMLETLGYKQTTTEVAGDFTWENLLTFAAEKNLKTVANATNFTVANVATATMETLKANVKGATKTLADSLVEAKVITADQAAKAGLVSALAVTSVTANTAKSFEVKFNKTVADTATMKFAATRGTVAATVTTTWNADKTVATLTAGSKLPEATYTVTVTNGTTEMAKKEVVITKEVVKTIEYKTDSIIRTSNTTGMLGFKVLNQYGEDVTNLALGRSLEFIVSTLPATAVVDNKAGILTISHSNGVMNELKDLQTVVVTARDASTGFVQTNNFKVSSTIGAVADIKLIGVIDETGKSVDFKYDLGKTYYLDYEVTDALGNKITNYDALTSSEYSQAILDVRSSNTTYVSVVATKHPNDSTKMVYRLDLTGTAPTYDTPITFLAIAPFAGKSSNLTVTLYKKARVETFRMQHPVETASVNKPVEIPFEAFDQAGNAVTLYDDLKPYITFSTAGVDFVRQGDGTAKLFATFTANQAYYITSTVTGSLTGSFSQIAIDVKKVAYPASVDPLRHASAYMSGATWDTVRVSDFAVRDQYDRVMNLRNDYLATAYVIKVTTSNPAIVSVNGGTTATISGDATIDFAGGGTPGTATLTYELIGPNMNKTGNPVETLDTASAIAYNVELKDIRSLALTVDAKPIYMTYGDAPAIALMADDKQSNDFELVGKTDSGMDVRLAPGAWYTLTNDKFIVKSNDVVQATGNFGNDTTATTILTGHYQGTNGILTATATVTANSAKPVVESVKVSYNNAARRAGNLIVNNDVIDVSAAWFNANVVGKSLLKYNTLGAKTATASLAQAYFEVTSQYGAHVAERVMITPKTGNTGTLNVTATATTTATLAGTVSLNDEYTVTCLANNGKSKVIRFRVTRP